MIKSYLCQFCGIERDDGWHDCFHALKALVRELEAERDEALRMENQAHERVAELDVALEKYGQHLRGCKREDMLPCSCGFIRAIQFAAETVCECMPLSARGEPGDLEVYCPKCGKVFRKAETGTKYTGPAGNKSALCKLCGRQFQDHSQEDLSCPPSDRGKEHG